jgi:hypothetical protein
MARRGGDFQIVGQFGRTVCAHSSRSAGRRRSS